MRSVTSIYYIYKNIEAMFKRVDPGKEHDHLAPSLFTYMEFIYYKNDILHEEVNQSTIEKEFVLPKASVNNALTHLEEKGYVNRVEDKLDKRKKLVSLTPEGKEIYLKIAKDHDIVSEALFKGFDKKERETLAKLLNKVVINIRKEKLNDK